MLIQLDIAHVCIDVEQNDEALARVKQLGYLQTPVVVTAHEHWLGHQPEKLAALIAQRK
jgi:glutaredoxin-like protein NrdH